MQRGPASTPLGALLPCDKAALEETAGLLANATPAGPVVCRRLVLQ